MKETTSRAELDTQIASLERSIKAAAESAERQIRDFGGDAHSVMELIVALKSRLRTAKKARAELR